MTRTYYLIAMAMLMFTAGVVVQIAAESLSDRVLAGVAIVGALAVVLANVNGKGDHH